MIYICALYILFSCSYLNWIIIKNFKQIKNKFAGEGSALSFFMPVINKLIEEQTKKVSFSVIFVLFLFYVILSPFAPVIALFSFIKELIILMCKKIFLKDKTVKVTKHTLFGVDLLKKQEPNAE